MIDFAEQPRRRKSPKPKVPSPKSDTANHFEVVKSQTGIAIIQPPMARQVLSPERAINLAAWLMITADPTGEQFERVVKEIVKT